MKLIPRSLRAVWPLAWASTVRNLHKSIGNIFYAQAMVCRSHADLVDIQQAAIRLVTGPTDSASRGAAIAELDEALCRYAAAGHFKTKG